MLVAGDGQTGLELFRKEGPDLAIVDVMLPKMDGFDFCRAARKDSRVPILFLTARKEEVDRIIGLELGGDAYVTKPFSMKELLARVRALLRRTRPAKSAPRRAGGLELDAGAHELRLQGKPVALSPKDFALLSCLWEADGKALTREHLLEKIWGPDRSMEIDLATIDQYVARLRGKLGPEAGRLITVKNVGYRLKLD